MVDSGRFLDMNLSDGTIAVTYLPDGVMRKFLGGRGLGAWLLHRKIKQKCHPLEPENILILSCGLLTGTAAPVSSRLHLSAKSPLTGLLGSSNVGGHFGAALRSCGFQGILIRGRAGHPVYLWIRDGEAAIRDGRAFWGMDTWETEECLRQDLGDHRARIMAIGPGGESLVSFACVITSRDHAAGRTGMGAVMGSKNLKAIAVLGQEKRTEIAHATDAAVKCYVRQIKASPRFRKLSTFGTAGFIQFANDMGVLATRNYRESRFEDFHSISGERIAKYVTRRKGCHRCPVRCKADIAVNRDGGTIMQGTRPEFEPIIALGSKCGLSNTEAVLHLCDLCSRLGIDSISAGGVIAFAMDLFDRGILTLRDTGGLDLAWGNHKAMETLIRQMVHRTGLGDLLAHGVRQAARILGGDADRFAHHAKGLELTGYDPRGLMGTALGYAVSARGGDFTSVYATPEYRWSPEKAEAELGTCDAADRFSILGKETLIRRCLIVSAALDSLGICKVPALGLISDFDLKNEAALVSALMGWDFRPEELLRAGERVVNVERLFNLDNGAGAEDDRLPEKFEREPIAEGPAEGHRVELEPMLKAFYSAMEWDDRGYPSEQKLAALDLHEVCRRIKRGKTKAIEAGPPIPRANVSAGNRWRVTSNRRSVSGRISVVQSKPMNPCVRDPASNHHGG